MNRQSLRHLRFWAAAVFGLLVLNASSKKAVAQNTFPTPSGNVGIGTTAPTVKLEVSGTVAAPSSLATNPITSVTFVLSDTSGTVGAVMGTVLNTYSYDTYLQARHLTTGNTAYNLLLQPLGGNVGIGTGPSTKLHLLTTTDADGLIIENSTATNGTRATIFLSSKNASPAIGNVSIESVSVASAYPDMVFRTLGLYSANAIGAERMRITSDGKVGIGTSSPASALSIFGGTSNINIGSYGYGYNGIWLNGSTATTHYNLLSRASDGQLFINRPSGSDIYFMENNATTNMIIKSGGKVGIGKDPAVALDVLGDINLTGTIHAKYQDVAEWVPSSEQLAAGTVVVLDSTKSNQVISSSVSYDTRVAGVISAKPGIALGEKSESKVLVATTGRVKVKVDASKSPIQIGDLLVTSDIPGVAMKSEAVNLGGVQFHRPGTLIGKALEPLQKGSGEILVLLSLQ